MHLKPFVSLIMTYCSHFFPGRYQLYTLVKICTLKFSKLEKKRKQNKKSQKSCTCIKVYKFLTVPLSADWFKLGYKYPSLNQYIILMYKKFFLQLLLILIIKDYISIK